MRTMGEGRLGTDLLTGTCVLILWYTTGLSWWLFCGLFVAAIAINNVAYILRMQRVFKRIKENIHEDLSAEMEAARKREVAKVGKAMKDDQGRTVN